MAMFTIIKYASGFFFGYTVFIIFAGLMFPIRYENPMWDGMPTHMIAFADQLYGVWILFAVLIAAVLIIFGINEANKNRSLEV